MGFVHAARSYLLSTVDPRREVSSYRENRNVFTRGETGEEASICFDFLAKDQIWRVLLRNGVDIRLENTARLETIEVLGASNGLNDL